MSPRTGRPKVENPMNDRIYVRVTREEKEKIMKFSSESGYSILELIRFGIEKLKGQKKITVTPRPKFVTVNPLEISLYGIF